MYVNSRGGWFSDRSICYLASGRPVLAQDTGRKAVYDAGLLTFSTADGAAAAIEEVVRDYPRHRRAAREIAEAEFDSDIVLSRLLGKLGVA
jgi:glycosyltransferase involved in cell wall biosynthesis